LELIASTGMGCVVTEYTGEEFVPRIVSLSEFECIVIDSITEACFDCINIHHPSDNYLITSATSLTLPRGIYGCRRTSCAKRSVEDSSEDSRSQDSSISTPSPPSPPSKSKDLKIDASKSLKSKSKDLKIDASKSKNRPSKLGSKSPSSSDDSSSRSSSDGSDSLPNLDSFDLVIYVGVDPQNQMFVDAPLTSTTQSTSNNRNLIAAIVIGLGLLVLGVALLSYWMKKKDSRTTEQSHLFTNRYHSYI
jgi:hypothetical protein